MSIFSSDGSTQYLTSKPTVVLTVSDGAWFKPENRKTADAQSVAVRALGIPLWSGKIAPPDVGSVVLVSGYQMGRCTVVRYFTECGFLGVEVKPHRPPRWHTKQNGAGATFHAMGCDLVPQTPPKPPRTVVETGVLAGLTKVACSNTLK